jgi:hypothetical protein
MKQSFIVWNFQLVQSCVHSNSLRFQSTSDFPITGAQHAIISQIPSPVVAFFSE